MELYTKSKVTGTQCGTPSQMEQTTGGHYKNVMWMWLPSTMTLLRGMVCALETLPEYLCLANQIIIIPPPLF